MNHKFSEWIPGQVRDELIQWARQAATAAGDNLAPFSNRVLVITHPATDLFGGPNGAVTGDGRDGNGMSSVSPSLMGQEMGHVYGLDHSWFADREYGDQWDIMSTRNNSMAPHPFFNELDAQGRPIFRLGPGMNAANMSGRGWLDPSRVWRPSDEVEGAIVKLRPLHRRDLLDGFLCAIASDFFVEFRVREAWDAQIPAASAVLVHSFSLNKSTLLTADNGQDNLQAGAEFSRGFERLTPYIYRTRVKVVDINAVDRVATLEVTRKRNYPRLPEPDAMRSRVASDAGGLIVIDGKALNVPPLSPLGAMLEEVAKLQQTDDSLDTEQRDQRQRDSLRAIASLANDQLSRMNSPLEPAELTQTELHHRYGDE
jgi:hypothetical protein